MLVPLRKATFIRRLTRSGSAMTMRKRVPGARAAPLRVAGGDGLRLGALAPAPKEIRAHPASPPGLNAAGYRWRTGRCARVLAGTLLCLALAGAGCATSGPLHLYSLSEAVPGTIRDAGDGGTTEAPSFVGKAEGLTGFAYDPYTDHFFLRLAPGNRIRVVDRPARTIKREFNLEGPPAGGGDLTVRPRDGHLFLIDSTAPTVWEFTRLGKPVRTIVLETLMAAPRGIAYDAGEDALLLYLPGAQPQIVRFSMQGALQGVVAVERELAGPLAFDAVKREIYAPLAPDGRDVGVFDQAGRLLRPAAAAGEFLDVGVRSFIRVF